VTLHATVLLVCELVLTQIKFEEDLFPLSSSFLNMSENSFRTYPN
jgi:hypothetical protein